MANRANKHSEIGKYYAIGYSLKCGLYKHLYMYSGSEGRGSILIRMALGPALIKVSRGSCASVSPFFIMLVGALYLKLVE